MIVGITGNNRVGKEIAEYLIENYSFKYLDVDQILKKIIQRFYIL